MIVVKESFFAFGFYWEGCGSDPMREPDLRDWPDPEDVIINKFSVDSFQ